MNRGQQQLDFGDEFKDITRHGDGRKQGQKIPMRLYETRRLERKVQKV